MSAQPGWYDAGVPGRQRWWDGTQWTAHERDAQDAVQGAFAPDAVQGGPVPGAVQGGFAPDAVQGAFASVQAPAAASVPPISAQAAPMGWYRVPGAEDVRWWDGTQWTPYCVRKGRPLPDVFAVEPVALGIALGAVFLVLGLMRLAQSLLTSDGPGLALAALFFAVGVIWLIGSIRLSQIRKSPPPQSAAVLDPSTRPLPGEVEGAGAGWYPMTRQVSRWWTGTRWSWYLGMKIGVRPGHAGPRGYLTSLIMGWILTGLGALMMIVGIGFLIVPTGDFGMGVAGVLFLICGVFVAGAGAFVLFLTRHRRNAMLLPTTPPPVR